MISIFAPKGGVGKTTVSVNTAVALREQTRSNVLLFDADVGVGNVTSVLAVKYRMGLADLADSAPGGMDRCRLRALRATTLSRPAFASSPGAATRPSPRMLSVDLLLAALRWAKAHHSYVVVDTHPGYDDRTMAMLALANEILLVVTPEVGSLRNSAQFLGLAREVGLGDIVRVVVNRANHGIRAAGHRGRARAAGQATWSQRAEGDHRLERGAPVVSKFPREKISDDLHAVARLISEPDAGMTGPVPAGGKRGWWTRFGTRTSEA